MCVCVYVEISPPPTMAGRLRVNPRYIYTYIYIYIHIYIYIYICIYICVCVCVIPYWSRVPHRQHRDRSRQWPSVIYVIYIGVIYIIYMCLYVIMYAYMHSYTYIYNTLLKSCSSSPAAWSIEAVVKRNIYITQIGVYMLLYIHIYIHTYLSIYPYIYLIEVVLLVPSIVINRGGEA